jgi:3-methyladenine DNA glycosylase AlkD
MARYGMTPAGRLGVSVPEMRHLARRIGTNHALALRLWATGIQEARMVASMIADPQRMTAREMDAWVRDLDSWDVCDQACMNLFERSPKAWTRALAWTGRKGEFVRRAGFVLLARLAQTDRTASDQQFLDVLPVAVQGAADGRNYVKKAVSWTLRQIGKRNARLRAAVLSTARELSMHKAPSARWIASDVAQDLSRSGVRSGKRP